MESLTLLEQESLGILKQLEYLCEGNGLRNLDKVENDKLIKIAYSDIDFSVLKRPINICNVEKYLQENGIDFHLILDFINDDPTTLEVSNDPLAIDTTLGIIKGKNIKEIKTKIVNLKNKLLGLDNNKTKPISIIFDTKKDSLVVNLISVSVPKETVERSILNILVERKTEVSWDEIISEDDKYEKANNVVKQKRISDASRRLNTKIIKKTELKIKLIIQRRNNYSLAKKVTKK